MGRKTKTKIEIKLKKNEREYLEQFIRSGTAKARETTRARILLFAHSKKRPSEICKSLMINLKTILNVKERYLEGGIKRALHDNPRPGQPIIFNGKVRAKITALACTTPPEGHAKWTLRLLADKAIELDYVESISHNHVGLILKKTKSKPISKSSGASRR